MEQLTHSLGSNEMCISRCSSQVIIYMTLHCFPQRYINITIIPSNLIFLEKRWMKSPHPGGLEKSRFSTRIKCLNLNEKWWKHCPLLWWNPKSQTHTSQNKWNQSCVCVDGYHCVVLVFCTLGELIFRLQWIAEWNACSCFLYIEFCAFFPLDAKALAELQVQILYVLLILPSRPYNYMDLNGTWHN